MKLNKGKKGISLIVLVITIIVMIILATAIILSISGSDIRGKADEAVMASDLSVAREIAGVARSEWEIDEEKIKANGYETFESYAESKLLKAGVATSDLIVEESGNIKKCMAVCDGIKCGSFEQLRTTMLSLKNETREIVLKDDVVVTEKFIPVPSGTTVILDLNGKKITGNTLLIHNNGDLTIKDSSSNKTGEIVATGDPSKYNRLYDFNGNGVVDELDKKEVLAASVSNISYDPKYDLNNDGKVDIYDATALGKGVNGVFAINNNQDESKLTIIDIAEEKIKGYPTAIQNYGTVIGTTDYWDF